MATLEELEKNAQVLYIIAIVTFVAVFILTFIKAIAFVTDLCVDARNTKLQEEAAATAKKAKEAQKASKSNPKKGKSKKSAKSAKSKNSKTSSSKSSAKKSAEKKKAPPNCCSKLSAAEKKPEASGGKKSAESAPKKECTLLIELQPHDTLLSISSSKSDKSLPISGIGEEFDYKKEVGKVKTEKDYPEVSTPPQSAPKSFESEKVQQLPGKPGAAESIRKVADVSSPPPLMSGPKPNTDSLMLPVSTPPLAPVPLPISPPPPYSTDVTTTWISSSSSGNSKGKNGETPPKI